MTPVFPLQGRGGLVEPLIVVGNCLTAWSTCEKHIYTRTLGSLNVMADLQVNEDSL